MSWINVSGMLVVLLMLLPNIVYAIRTKGSDRGYHHPAVIVLEQVGRYASIFLMSFNIWIFTNSFSSTSLYDVWGICVIVLLVAYWICWIFYFRKPMRLVSILLAIIPSLIFILSGIFGRNWLLLACALLFSVCHLYITVRNTVSDNED